MAEVNGWVHEGKIFVEADLPTNANFWNFFEDILNETTKKYPGATPNMVVVGPLIQDRMNKDMATYRGEKKLEQIFHLPSQEEGLTQVPFARIDKLRPYQIGVRFIKAS